MGGPIGEVRPIALALLVGTACGPSPLELPFPTMGAASVIAVARSAESAQVIAADLPGPSYHELSTVDGALELTAAYFDCRLEYLGVPSGGPRLDDQGSLHPWRRAQRIERLDLRDDDDPHSWAAVPPGDPSLNSLLLSAPTEDARCERLDADRITLPGTDGEVRITVALPLGPAKVLFAFDQPVTPLLVEPDRVSAAPLPAVGYLAAADLGAGELLVVTATGATWRGRLGEQPRSVGDLVRRPANSFFPGRLLTSAADEPFEVYLYSITGALERFDGVRWTLLAETATVSSDGAVGMIRLGPGELILAPGNRSEVYYYKDGFLRTELPRLNDKIRSLGQVPGFGPLAGSDLGHVLERRRAGDWVELGVTGLEHAVRAFGPFADGFLTGGGFGGLTVQYHPEPGIYCRPNEVVATEFIALLPFGEDLLVVPRRKDGGPLRPAILRRPVPFPRVSCR